MRNSQHESSSQTSQAQQQLDFQRFQTIWNNIKHIKQSSSNQSGYYQNQKRYPSSNQRPYPSSSHPSIVSVKKAIQHEQQKNIQTRLILTQKQLQKSKENTNLLLKKLSQAQQQIQYLQYQLDKQVRQKKQLTEQYKQMSQRIVKQTNQHKKQNKNQQAQTQIQKLTKKLQFKQKQLDKLILKLKSLQLTIKNQSTELKSIHQNKKIVQNKLEQLNQQIDNQNQLNLYSHEQGPGKGTQLLQLQQAYKTIQRLILLLRNTQQYKSFSFAIQDFKQSHFLKQIPQRLKKNQLISKISIKKSCSSCMQIKIDEKLLWSPLQCYKKALQLKLKYEILSEPCIQQLLFQLNKLYGSKQQNLLSSQKNYYQSQLSKLKKRLSPCYDQLVARKQIQRLKKQISTDKYQQKDKQTDAINNIQLLKSIGQYQDQLRLKEKEIKLLRDRIKLIQTQAQTYDKHLYLEGTLWILDKVLIQMQTNNQDFSMFQNKFRQRIQTIQTSEQSEQWINCFKYFFQNVTQMQHALLQKLLMMKESTVKKMGPQKNRILDKQSMFNETSFN